MSAILREDSAVDAGARPPERLPITPLDPMKHAGLVLPSTEQDEEHDRELDHESSMSDRHAVLYRDRVGRIGLPPERRERRPRVAKVFTRCRTRRRPHHSPRWPTTCTAMIVITLTVTGRPRVVERRT